MPYPGALAAGMVQRMKVPINDSVIVRVDPKRDVIQARVEQIVPVIDNGLVRYSR